MIITTDARPHYYLAVFGDPEAPGHVHVEDGRYGHKNQPSELAPGDMVLLYCTSTYRRYAKTVPGFGIVNEVDHTDKQFAYDYFPLREPVPIEALRFRFEGSDRDKLGNIRFDTYWFFRVNSESFAAVMRGALLGKPLDSDTQQGPRAE